MIISQREAHSLLRRGTATVYGYVKKSTGNLYTIIDRNDINRVDYYFVSPNSKEYQALS